MKIAVITAITGGMDTFKEWPYQINIGSHDVSFHRYVDSDVPGRFRHLNPRTQALYFKQQMHEYLPGFDVYLWLDGKIQVLCADFIEQCLGALGDSSLAILKHGERNCVFDEVRHIQRQIRHRNAYLTARYGDRDLISQAKTIAKLNYPAGAGLNDCSIIAVRGDDAAQMLFKSWWDMCQDQKAFDQIWIRALAWLNKIEIKNIVLKPASFKLVKHLKVQ